MSINHSIRLRARIVVAATVASVTAVCLMLAGPAFAGETAPPPLDGYIDFAPGQASLVCTDGVPTAVTFSASWDATHLATAPEFDAQVFTRNQNSANQVAAPDIGVVAGQPGTYTATIPLTPGPTDTNVAIQVEAPSTQVDFVFADAALPLTCPGQSTSDSPAPTYSISQVDCTGDATVTVDGFATTEDWHGTTLFPAEASVHEREVSRPARSRASR